MHISFINATLGGDFSAIDIAILSLATYINERTPHKASIIDLTFHRRYWQKHIYNRIRSLHPDIIAFSTNDLYMNYVRQCARFVKEKFDLPIVVGGYYASIHWKKAIEPADFDYVIVGDGEHSLSSLLDALQNKTKISENGILYNCNGHICGNNYGRFIEDLSSLPAPDYNLFRDLDKYFYFLGMLYMIGTRGCPYNCTYCDAIQIKPAVQGHYYRILDPNIYVKQIWDNWKRYKSRGMRFLQLFDQVPALNSDWIYQFTEAYKQRGLHTELGWSCFSRIDNLDEQKIKWLSSANCKIVRVGIEAGNDFVRQKIYRKLLSKEQIMDKISLLKKYNIGMTAYYILGGPGETRRTIKETIDFARILDATRSVFFIYKPFTSEGTRILQKYGGYVDEKRMQKADNITFDAVVHLKDIGPERIELYQKTAYFYTFGRRLLRTLRRLKWKYFYQLFTYILKGVSQSLSIYYLLIYYHIYGYDNVDK